MYRGPPPAYSFTPRNAPTSMPIGPAPFDGFFLSLRKAMTSRNQTRIENLLANNFVFRGFGKKMNKVEFTQFIMKLDKIGTRYETGSQLNSHYDLEYRALFQTYPVTGTLRIHVGLHYDGQRFILACASEEKVDENECIAIGFVNDFLNAVNTRVSTKALNLFSPKFQFHVEEGVVFGDETVSNYLETLRAAPRVVILSVQKFPMIVAVIEMELMILDLAEKPIYTLFHLVKGDSGKWRLVFGKNRSEEAAFH